MNIHNFLGPENHLVGFVLDFLVAQPLLIPHLIFDVIHQILELGEHYGYGDVLLRFEVFREHCYQILEVLELFKAALGQVEDEERNKTRQGGYKVLGEPVGVVHVIQTWDVQNVYLVPYQVVAFRISRQDYLYLFKLHKILSYVLLDSFYHLFPTAVLHPFRLPPALEHLLYGISLPVTD